MTSTQSSTDTTTNTKSLFQRKEADDHWWIGFLPLVAFGTPYIAKCIQNRSWLDDLKKVPMVLHLSMVHVIWTSVYVLMTIAWCIQPDETWLQLLLFLFVPAFHVTWIWLVSRQSWILATYALQWSQLCILLLVFLTTDWYTRIAFLPINTLVGWLIGYTTFVANRLSSSAVVVNSK